MKTDCENMFGENARTWRAFLNSHGLRCYISTLVPPGSIYLMKLPLRSGGFGTTTGMLSDSEVDTLLGRSSTRLGGQ